MDAKILTAGMANRMMLWAEFGRPNESVAPPRESNHGLFPGGYYVLDANPSETLTASIAANEKARLNPEKAEPKETHAASLVSWHDRSAELWKGWVLPASDDDTWFVAGSASYYRLLQARDVEQAINAEKIRYRGFRLSPDTPANRFHIQQAAGALFLDSLRNKMGDAAFLKLMKDYFAAHTTQTVTAQSFLDAAGMKYEVPDPGDGPAYLPGDIRSRLASAVIVYGTDREAGTNRYVAERLQAHYRERFQHDVPIYKDFEASASSLGHRDVIFVGRPETNSTLAGWQEQIGLNYQGAMFELDGKTFASERDGLVYAAKNPLDSTHMVLVYAGNSPLETSRAMEATGDKAALVLED
jgi:hypothetical protein